MIVFGVNLKVLKCRGVKRYALKTIPPQTNNVSVVYAQCVHKQDTSANKQCFCSTVYHNAICLKIIPPQRNDVSVAPSMGGVCNTPLQNAVMLNISFAVMMDLTTYSNIFWIKPYITQKKTPKYPLHSLRLSLRLNENLMSL